MSTLKVTKVEGKTSDALQLGNSSAGTLNMVEKSITMPNRPAFLAMLAATVANHTGDGTGGTIVFDAEIFDQGGDFNIATGVFTATVSGRYRLSMVVNLSGLVAGHTQCTVTIACSNRSFNGGQIAAFAASTGGELERAITALCDMDAGDTASAQVIISGGTKVVDLTGVPTNPYTYFCGELVA